MESTVLRAKLIVLGDASVGKSSLVQVFHSDSQQGFPKAYSMTTGTTQSPLFYMQNLIYEGACTVSTSLQYDRST